MKAKACDAWPYDSAEGTGTYSHVVSTVAKVSKQSSADFVLVEHAVPVKVKWTATQVFIYIATSKIG
jgi:hypothetical protein